MDDQLTVKTSKITSLKNLYINSVIKVIVILNKSGINVMKHKYIQGLYCDSKLVFQILL